MPGRIQREPIPSKRPMPQRSEIGRGNGNDSARLEHAKTMPQDLKRVMQMLDDMIHSERVEMLRWKRIRFEQPGPHIQVRGNCLCRRFGIGFDAGDLPTRLAHLQQQFAIAAADIQQARAFAGPAQKEDRLLPALPAFVPKPDWWARRSRLKVVAEFVIEVRVSRSQAATAPGRLGMGIRAAGRRVSKVIGVRQTDGCQVRPRIEVARVASYASVQIPLARCAEKHAIPQLGMNQLSLFLAANRASRHRFQSITRPLTNGRTRHRSG